MLEDKKNGVDEKELPKEATTQELSLDDLDAVTGGGLSNVHITKPRPISQDTKDKI